VAAAEVVDRDLEAELAELGDTVADVFLPLERRALRDLEDHARGDLRQRCERARELLVVEIEQVEVQEHEAALGRSGREDLRDLTAHGTAELLDLLETLRGVEHGAGMRK